MFFLLKSQEKKVFHNHMQIRERGASQKGTLKVKAEGF